MAASKNWCKTAAEELERVLGRELALKAVTALIGVPGANKSAAATLAEVRAQLLPPDVRERAKKSLIELERMDPRTFRS